MSVSFYSYSHIHYGSSLLCPLIHHLAVVDAAVPVYVAAAVTTALVATAAAAAAASSCMSLTFVLIDCDDGVVDRKREQE